MKTAIGAVMSLFLLVALGCESPRGGGVTSDEGFRISTPAFATTLKQGETQSVPISLSRGEAFKRDVTLQTRTAKGLSVAPTQTVIKGNDRPDTQLRITAAKDADLGTYKVYVKGTPEIGESTTAEITVKVVAP